MQVTDDDLRQYYASLSDDELSHIDRSDLTESAQKHYDREFAARHLTTTKTAPTPQAVPKEEIDLEPLGVESDWIENAACPCSWAGVPGSNYAPMTERAQEVLLAAGIPCHLSVDPAPEGEQYDQYRVLVPQAFNLKAISLLDREIFNPELEADWRTHFAELSDDELYALDPEDLCAGLLDRAERLRKAYSDEVARRSES
ncbi:MAG: hypothetical protein JO099_10200 [Acidobacteriia bacterium]|nr:hypothetical protein [Terriglobia bacterium]